MVKKSKTKPQKTDFHCWPSEIQVLVVSRAILTIFLSCHVNITFSLPIPSEQLVNGNEYSLLSFLKSSKVINEVKRGGKSLRQCSP